MAGNAARTPPGSGRVCLSPRRLHSPHRRLSKPRCRLARPVLCYSARALLFLFHHLLGFIPLNISSTTFFIPLRRSRTLPCHFLTPIFLSPSAVMSHLQYPHVSLDGRWLPLLPRREAIRVASSSSVRPPSLLRLTRTPY